MDKTLTKQWKYWPAGTLVTTDQEVWQRERKITSGQPAKAVLVNGERMAQLEREGYFS